MNRAVFASRLIFTIHAFINTFEGIIVQVPATAARLPASMNRPAIEPDHRGDGFLFGDIILFHIITIGRFYSNLRLDDLRFQIVVIDLRFTILI